MVERSTGNPLTAGTRYCTRSLTDVLTERAGSVRLGEPLRELTRAPVVLATGGFQADRRLVRQHITPHADALCLRATPWSTATASGSASRPVPRPRTASRSSTGATCPRLPRGSAIPSSWSWPSSTRASPPSATRTGGYRTRTWSEIDVVQWTARQPAARAYYEVSEEQLGAIVGARSVGDMIDAADRAGARVTRRAGTVTVEVVAGITTTLGGLKVDTSAQAAPGVFAAGSDVGGIATGGYSSGLAAALVLGRVAARSALRGR